MSHMEVLCQPLWARNPPRETPTTLAVPLEAAMASNSKSVSPSAKAEASMKKRRGEDLAVAQSRVSSRASKTGILASASPRGVWHPISLIDYLVESLLAALVITNFAPLL